MSILCTYNVHLFNNQIFTVYILNMYDVRCWHIEPVDNEKKNQINKFIHCIRIVFV